MTVDLKQFVEQAGDPCGKPPHCFSELGALSDGELDRLLNIVIVEGRARGFAVDWFMNPAPAASSLS